MPELDQAASLGCERQRLWPVCPDPDECGGHTPACMHVEGGPLVMACRDCIKERQASGLVFCLSDNREVHQFIWETWTDEQRFAHMERVTDRQQARRDAGKPPLPIVCTCVDWCGESSEAGCPSCVQRDCYLPCDAIGSGCGDFLNETAKTCDDDCCAPWQWAAAASFRARIAEQAKRRELTEQKPTYQQDDATSPSTGSEQAGSSTPL